MVCSSVFLAHWMPHSILYPAFCVAQPLQPGQQVLCFAFGQGPDLTSGGTNRALAEFVRRALLVPSDGNTDAYPTVLAQWEIARELTALEVPVAFSAELDGKAYITTCDVLNKFVEQSPPQLNELPVAIVAHPDHAWRCWALATLAGYNAFVPDPGSVPDFKWSDFGCNSEGYDESSVQEHTVHSDIFCPKESQLQEAVLRANPWLEAD